MGHLINKDFLQTVGTYVAPDWIKLAKTLKIKNADIKAIEGENSDNIIASIAMLSKWQQQETRAEEYKMCTLRKALVQINRHDILNYLQVYEQQVLSLTWESELLWYMLAWVGEGGWYDASVYKSLNWERNIIEWNAYQKLNVNMLFLFNIYFYLYTIYFYTRSGLEVFLSCLLLLVDKSYAVHNVIIHLFICI